MAVREIGNTEQMRIVCPNCDAQYEVPDAVVPPEGRDVECSNCGKTWFQAHPDHVTKPAEQERPSPEPAPVETSADPVPKRRELDPRVAGILREEAKREQAARQAETLEVQTDLNLPEVEEPSAPPPMSPPAEEDPPVYESAPEASAIAATATAAAAATPRRELLPDIEEINSTLRSAGDRDAAGDDLSEDAPLKGRQKRSFRRGFLLAMTVFVAAILIYRFAPEIADQLPQADPWLSAYVTWVDELRVTLDGLVKTGLQWLDDQAQASQI